MPLPISASRVGPICCGDFPMALAMSPVRWGPGPHLAIASRYAFCGSDSRSYRDLKKFRSRRPIAASLDLAMSSFVMGETGAVFQAWYPHS